MQLLASLISDPGVVVLILARPHTFVEIDYEIYSTVILLLPQIQEVLLSVISQCICTEYLLVNNLVYICPGKQCGYVHWLSRHDNSCWLEGLITNKFVFCRFRENIIFLLSGRWEEDIWVYCSPFPCLLFSRCPGIWNNCWTICGRWTSRFVKQC